MTPDPIIDVALNAEDLTERVALWIANCVALAGRPVSLCLSGGSTPKRLYALLGSEGFRAAIDWTQLHIFWGDERFVPYDHPDSNYKMTHEAWLAHVPIPRDQIHPIPTDAGSPQKAAALYAKTLQNFYGATQFDKDRPLFDINLLGIGEDGHTASLFPGTIALDEREAWVTAIEGAASHPRISLTYPALGSSRTIVFLAAGKAKQTILKRVLAHDQTLPAARIETHGRILLYTDKDAVAEA
ncbi:6-phosphogluconolactonase [Beijerinckia indica]|uniref:6-phosphogluconolactonase n=1 Tax=Beijerinckia indica subsp. indica (strain ATCC 9039 / DSM 1715 / NCIMB 8712) TaxID=395963 RepID=B2IE85_BEII9|nr:6-phosphogluconolactonase [Beijerinckia indica]ACB94109.1 6-phosphogluconolactonase [Beijerinckia indica subsp. indica ATCC 9039]